MKRFFRNYLDDVLLLAGCGCILYGLSMWSVILTWIWGGVTLIFLGVLVAWRKAKHATN